MISLKNVSKEFGDIKVLKNVNFQVKENLTLGVLGPNGAGKSTTLKLLATLIKPSSGEILVNNLNVTERFDEVRKLIAFLPEAPPLYPELTVFEYLQIFLSIRKPGLSKDARHSEVLEKIKRCRLTSVKDSYCGILSKGFRQKVGLACALLGDPKILLLDEPTSGLDPREIVEIRTLIKELKTSHTILFSSHILSEVSELCDEVVMFLGGSTVFQASLEDLSARGGLEQNFLKALEGGSNV